MIRYKKITHNIRPLLPGLIKEIKADSEILFGYLFGSYGSCEDDKISPLSDVDIALYLKEDLSDFYSKKLELLELINRSLHTDEVDLVILNQAPVYLQFEIIKTGRLLFCREPQKRISFQVKVIKSYLDAKPLRDLAQAALLKRYGL